MASEPVGGVGAASLLRGQITQKGDGPLKAPKQIIPNLTAAKAVYFRMRANNLSRIALQAAIEGLIAGNPPYNPADLSKNKLSFVANFNNLDARSLVERAALAYWNLLNQTKTFISVEMRGDAAELPEFAFIIAEEFDYVVRKWPSFNVAVNTLAWQLVKFGVSPMVWADEKDWRWRVVELSKFMIEDQAPSDIDLLTTVCIESSFTAQYLFKVYEEFKDNKESNWCIEELKKFLLDTANSNLKNPSPYTDLMDLQVRLQDGDVTWDAAFTDRIRLSSILQQEYSGKYSHYMFAPLRCWENFLYKEVEQYDTFQEAMVIFTASPGEMTIHSNRGVGHKVFAPAQAAMQLDCSIVDCGRWAATPIISGQSTASRDNEAIRWIPGVPTNIGTAEFVNNQMGQNADQLIRISQYLLSKLNYNIANSGDDPSQPDKDVGSKSPEVFRNMAFKEFAVLKNNIAHFYYHFDQVVHGMFVKMLKSKEGCAGYEYAKEFKERCIERGVPEELFQTKRCDHWGLPRQFKNVKASRAAGDGSALATLMGLQEIQDIATNFGPKGIQVFERLKITAALGSQFVEPLLQDSQGSDEMAGGASLAAVENAIMQSGQSPQFSPDNEQRPHFVSHMALANDTIKRIQQQALNPIEADKVFSVLVPHLEDHFAQLMRSIFTQPFAKGMKKIFEQVRNYAALNRQNAAKMYQAELKKRQENQQQTEATLNEEQRKDIKLQGDERRANIKVEDQVNRAAKANENRAKVMQEKVHLDAQNEREKNRLEHANNPLENTSEADLRQNISNINGVTPAPFDIE